MISLPLPVLRHGVVVSLIGAAVLVCPENATLAEEPNSQPSPVASAEQALPQIRKVYVPADKPHLWPDGDWQPMRLDEFQSLLRSAQPAAPRPESTRVVRAEYSAALIDDTLREGRLTADVKHSSPQATLLVLDPLNLAVSELAWSDPTIDRAVGPATVWGTTSDGRTAVLVSPRTTQPSAALTLTGRWSLQGRRTFQTVSFDVRLAPAMVSVLRLRLPKGYRLTSSAGEVSGPHETESAEWTAWDVNLGGQSECRLSITPNVATTDKRPLILTETDLSYVVRQDGLQIQAEFDPEVLKAPVDALVFRLPNDLDVYSITYGGELPLSWSVRDAKDGRRYVVPLPDALQGRGRPIRLRALGRAVFETDWTLPAVTLEDAVLLTGQLHLKVEGPFQLRSFRGNGYRQISTVPGGADGETLTFRQSHPAATMTVNVGRPRLTLFGRSVNHLVTGTEQWLLTAQIEWRSQSGATFQGRCTIPQKWDVIDVRARNHTSSDTQIADWELQDASDGQRRLTIEFPDALDPNHPRAVLVVARRLPEPLPSRIDLPIIRPLDCQSIDTALLVSHPATTRPSLSNAPSWETAGDTPPSFVASSALWKEAQSRADVATLFVASDAPGTTGQLVLETTKRPVRAQVETAVLLDGRRLAERFQIRIQPQGGLVERLFVYLNAPGPRINWTLESEAAERIQSRRVPASEHDTWGLPQHGELWEIRLAEPLDHEFVVTGRRAYTASPVETPALAFVPESQDFHGSVELQILDNPNLTIETAGLLPIDDPPESARPLTGNGSPAAGGTGSSAVRSWSYRSLKDALTVRFQKQGPPDSEFPSARLKLRSLLFSGRGSHDLHWATFHLAQQPDSRSFRLRLPQPATLISARLNGRATIPLREADELVFAYLPERRSNTIEVHYRTPSTGATLEEWRPVVVPRSSYSILWFDWEFALPPDTRLVSEPEFLVLEDPLADLSWSERLFGPIGRVDGSAPFNLFSGKSWRGLIGHAAELDVAVRSHATPPAGFAPAGWTSFRAEAPALPETLVLTTWHPTFARRTGWIGLLLCLILGLVLRISRVRLWRTVTAIWFSACLIGAWWLPALYAVVLGGCFSGSLVALLIPRHVLSWRPRGQIQRDPLALASTVSFHEGPGPAASLLVLAVAAICGVRAAAQDAGAERSDRTESPATLEASVETSKDYTILVPVDSQTQPPRELPLVYVTRVLIDELKRRQHSAPDRSVESLIISADYEGHVDEHEAVTLKANYRAAVLSSVRVMQIFLPISNANLGGPDACLVNGTPQPVQLGPQGNGLIVPLPAAEPRKGPIDPVNVPADHGARPLRPVAAPVPRDHVAESRGVKPPGSQRNSQNDVLGAGHRPEGGRVRSQPPLVSMFHITLSLHPPTVPVPGGSSFQIGIPPVPASRLIMTFSDPKPTVDVPTARGAHLQADDPRTARYELGKSDELHVAWSDNAEPIQPPASLETRVACLVKAHRTWAEVRCTAAYHVLRGNTDFVLWRIPPGMIVRDVTADSLRDDATVSLADNDSYLLVRFSNPQTEDFVVNATFLLVVATAEDGVRIPALDFFGGEVGTLHDVNVTSLQVGISAAPEFRVTAPRELPEHVQSIASDRFLKQSGFPPDVRKPDLAYQVSQPSELTVHLEALRPHRSVRQSEEGRVHGNRLDWTYTAHIETTQAAAFVHSLLVDPRLQIESLSVEEDEANRLSRWSRLDDRLVLFLSDQTTGVQTLVLRGHVPLNVGTDLALPTVRLEEAEVTDSELRLTRDPDLTVELLKADGTPMQSQAGTPTGGLTAENREPETPGDAALLWHSRLESDLSPLRRPRVRVVRRNNNTPPSAEHENNSAERPSEGGPPLGDRPESGLAGGIRGGPNRSTGDRLTDVPVDEKQGLDLHEAPRATLSLRSVPGAILRGVLAVAAILLAAWGVPKMVPLQIGPWLDAHPGVCWALLGVWWWGALTPSWLGLLFLTCAGIHALRMRGRKTHSLPQGA